MSKKIWSPPPDKTFPDADCNSDRVPLCGQIKVRVEREIKNTKLSKDILRSDNKIQERFRVIVRKDTMQWVKYKT